MTIRVHRSAIPVFLYLSCCIAAFPGLSARAQFNCGMHAPAATGNTVQDIFQHNGCHLPSKGRVRGLVLFIQTLEDNAPNDSWPSGQLPLWADSYSRELAEYFGAMSNGAMTMQLDVHPTLLRPFGTEWDYLIGSRRLGDATKDIIKSIDPQVDFSLYDNWKSEGRPYFVEPGADGRIDLIIAVYRRVENGPFFNYSGVSDLNFRGYLFLDDTDKFIYGGSGLSDDAASSGITVTWHPGSGLIINLDLAVRVSIHEIMHKVYGEGHPAELFGGLGVLSTGGSALGLHSFERHLLGYMSYSVLPDAADTTIVLRDYLSTNNAAALPIQGAPGWYYAFEFRNKSSRFDTAPSKGLYISRINDSWSKSQKEIHVIPASGNWIWANDSTTGKIFRTAPAPLGGYNILQKIPVDGKPRYAEGWEGDPLAAFTLERPLFNVWTNPTPDFILRSDTIRTDIFVTLIAMDDSTATVHISHTPPVILGTDQPGGNAFSIDALYPNPVLLSRSAHADIAFTLASRASVSLHVHDMLGRNLLTSLEGELPAGAHTARLDANSLPPGTYWCVLRAEGTARTRMLRVLR